MNRSSILATTMAMMGLSMPGASRARAVSRSRFDGQSAEAKEQALAKAAAKRERRNEKRLNDQFRSKINNPIWRRQMIRTGQLFVDGPGTKDPEQCPVSYDGVECPECGKALDPSYGFAGGYGLGSYNYCEDHGVFDFYAVPDELEAV